MKKKKLRIPLGLILLVVGLCLYFGAQSAQYFSDPLSTVTAYAYHMEESQDVTGYVVRDELVLPNDEAGLLHLDRLEGERVSAHGVIGSTYTDQASVDREMKIQALTDRIEQLQYSQDMGQRAEAAAKLDNQILYSLTELRTALSAGEMDLVQEHGQSLRTQVLKRDGIIEDDGDLTQEIQDLQAQRKKLQSQGSGTRRSIRAPKSGLYSGVVDGFETVLTPKSIQTMTPDQLSKVEADPAVRSNVGKLVRGNAWYYAVPMLEKEIQEIQDADNLRIHFTKGTEEPLPVELTAVGPQEDGRAVAVFEGRTQLSRLTLLRQQSAQVITNATDGIRIPKSALWSEKTAVDPKTGEAHTEQGPGVYCVMGREARFKPVEVLNSAQGFLLVRATGDEVMTQLRPGDEVIIKAHDLFDGKVVR